MMVEAMVAMSVIVIGLLGAFALSSGSISLNRTAADRYVAVNLAGEGIELVKNIIDRNIMLVEPINIAWDNGISEGDYEIDHNDLALKPLEGGGARILWFSKDGSGYYAYNDAPGLDPDLYVETAQKIRRVIKIENISAEHLKITSTVFWISRGSDLEFSVEDHFYNFKDSYYKYNLNN